MNPDEPPGILEVKEAVQRAWGDPGTGEAIEIAASEKVAFRPAKELKEAIERRPPAWPFGAVTVAARNL